VPVDEKPKSEFMALGYLKSSCKIEGCACKVLVKKVVKSKVMMNNGQRRIFKS